MNNTFLMLIRSICIVLAIFFICLAIQSIKGENNTLVIKAEKNAPVAEVQRKIELHSQIEIIDSCEYIVFCSKGWENLNEGRISITSVHKANCKNHSK